MARPADDGTARAGDSETQVQLHTPTPTGPPPGDIANALTAARDALGQRPAVTVLSARGREEQGFASLAQWAAKGAHLLDLDLLLEPGDRLLLDAPASWTTAAVALAAWWSGIEVVLPGHAMPGGAAPDTAPDVAVVHEDRRPPTGVADVLWLGDAIDGAPRTTRGGDAWVRAVQTFPDQPPQPRGSATGAALRLGDRARDQGALLADAAVLAEGTLGIEPGRCGPWTATVAVAVRPLVAHRPTVVLDGVPRTRADADRVTTWL